MQHHTQQVVAVAHALTANTPLADDLMLAALLHDIGYWVLENECPRELEQAHAYALATGVSMHEAERQIIGASHAEFGAYLLGIWGLPYSVVEAVAHHHHPERVQQKKFDVLAGLVVAHTLAAEDDAIAFAGPPAHDGGVNADYLATLETPFSWDDAQERVAAHLTSGLE
jgi:putative nucleotidyltransferase with HDIG domain